MLFSDIEFQACCFLEQKRVAPFPCNVKLATLVQQYLQCVEQAVEQAVKGGVAMQVNEYDCLLLEFVFGNRPDDSQKVRAYVLDSIASDPELQKAEILFLGSFGRACEFLAAGDAEVRGHPHRGHLHPSPRPQKQQMSTSALALAARSADAQHDPVACELPGRMNPRPS